MDAGFPFFGLIAQLGIEITQLLLPLWREVHLVGFQVPIPNADRRSLDRDGQPFFAGAKGFLGSFAVGRIAEDQHGACRTRVPDDRSQHIGHGKGAPGRGGELAVVAAHGSTRCGFLKNRIHDVVLSTVLLRGQGDDVVE
ncbi:MAG: hypothetical protein NBKEAIPA_02821 [Nitrospirae bacterium]|nr:hypothetical protein [Nitrospirota bacterium]